MRNKFHGTLLLFLMQFIAIGVFAQAPSLINYQGTARLADGTPLDNRNISIKFDLRETSSSGSIIATETQTIQTNALGLFSTLIGQSTNLSNINWQGTTMFLQVSMDTSAGTNFISVGVQQLVSVPYAIHAASVPSSYTNNILSIGTSTYALSPTIAVTPNASITVSGLGTVTSAGTNTFDINIPSATFSNTGQQIITGSYPNFTVNTPTVAGAVTPSITLTSTAAPGTSVTSSGSSFSLNVPPPNFTNAGPATITGAYPNFTINSSTGITYTNGAGIGLTSGSVIVNTLPNITPTVAVTTTAAAGASVASSGSSFSLNVPPPTFTNAGPATITGAYPNFTISSTAAPSYTSGTGISITSGSINNTAPDQTVTFTNTGQTLVTGTYPTFSISTPTIANTSIALTSTTAAGPSLTTSGTNSFNINIPPASDWSLLGNAGTSTLSNFVGTTDNVALNFRVFNQQSGIIDPILQNTNFGYRSGSSYSSGNGNVGFGYRTLFANTTGGGNTGVGYRALSANTVGGGNTALGSDALLTNTTGLFNSALGLNAGRGNTTGSNNTALGRDALYNNSVGSSNIAIGYQAGYYETGSNKLYISNSSSSVTPLIYGDFSTNNLGIGTTNANAPLQLANTVANRKIVMYETTNNDHQFYGFGVNSGGAGGVRYQVDNVFANHIFYSGINSSSSKELLRIQGDGNVGIGTSAPTATLHVLGTTRLVDGSEGLGKVLTSDASGNATWQAPSSSNWGITGNAATSSATNFIGTSDNVALNFRVNNLKSGIIDPALLNTAFGYQSFTATTTGSNNAAFGYRTLNLNSTGNGNSAFGSEALSSINSGDNNTAVGYNALTNNNAGTMNTAIGASAMSLGTGGAQNVAVGMAALRGNLTGNYNVAIGFQAGNNNTGTGNVFMGYLAGNNNTGGLNVFLGYQAGSNMSGSGKLVIANSATTVSPLIYGDFSTGHLAIGTATANGELQFNNTINGRKIVLWEGANNDHQVYGIGTNVNTLRYQVDNAVADHVFYSGINSTTSLELMRIAGTGYVTIGAATPAIGNTGLLIARNGAFDNRLVIAGGDNSNSYGGIITLAENISQSQGMSIRLNASSNRLWITTNTAGTTPVVSVGGYTGSSPGVVIGTGYALSTSPPNDGLLVEGNVGIGTTAPTATLHVAGTTRLVDGSQGAGKVLSSDASGNASWVNSSINTGFMAEANAGQSISTAVITTVNFGSENYDDSNSFASSQYVCSSTGLYHFDATVSWNGFVSANNWTHIYIYRNGTLEATRMIATSTGFFSNTISANIKCTVGDAVTVRVYQQSGSTQSIYTTSNYTHFSGYRVY